MPSHFPIFLHSSIGSGFEGLTDLALGNFEGREAMFKAYGCSRDAPAYVPRTTTLLALCHFFSRRRCRWNAVRFFGWVEWRVGFSFRSALLPKGNSGDVYP